MKLVVFFLTVYVSLQACKSHEVKLPILLLPNEGIIKLTDSLKFDLDSLTVPNSENIYLIDSILYVCNAEANQISKININTNTCITTFLNFLRFGKAQKFSAILVQNTRIYAILRKSKKGFVFNTNGILLDSFKLGEVKDSKLGNNITDNPLVSTIQPLLINDSVINSLGYTLIEGSYFKNINRFVLCASSRNSKDFHINYPKAYEGKNWGGTYMRWVYGTTIHDSLMIVSFPASSDLAIFNSLTKTTRYINCFPNIDTVVTPVGSMKELNKKQIDIAKHFFKQYSFQAIIYDKYRNVFYRILFKPIPIENKNENSIGNFDKQILVYDASFKYLGYTQIKGSLYSNSTYLVNSKGLLIQKTINNNDEDHIYFDLFTFDSNVSRKLQTKK